ncbi:hypothetical protein [Sulfitobacter donghicola]|uniref:Uncharacterized protein n=1 Tax=Sulfitobacter donghicola DSW-25 = KCTC 12864 = JCM 14565 TaxID=1300350 RepID=A0A073IFR7_9RHOB|nr:hypothetical protein [Sulfitobacter donghicola]KEJ88574.1 hypothetical protein DSW25_14735 [Sulfitobacter donghicola DSW-25 = KCTC 12864 = JCM 14565]KIN69782.1 hypothetical protein Z948_3531 [Sulfitobacter donghicola DSW-25 = KCTC 12864 = JCM 14565]
MSQDIFNQRIARINNHAGYGKSEMATGEGTATSMFSSPSLSSSTPTARRNVKPMLLGAVLGMVVGTIAAGLENAAMPWGPGFEYNEMITIPTLLALCAGPVMAIAGSAMRGRFPSFFFFAAAYFPCVIAMALLELPLF